MRAVQKQRWNQETTVITLIIPPFLEPSLFLSNQAASNRNAQTDPNHDSAEICSQTAAVTSS